MKIIGINGSPRKTWNTALMLESALAGAASGGAETELVHLYDLNYKGCISCFACKLKGGSSYGRCAMRDELTPVLDALDAADGIILGSPIYFCTVTGEMRSFMERLLFQYLAYTMPPSTLFPRRIPTAFLYTMNMPEDMVKTYGYDVHPTQNEAALSHVFGRSESLCAFETLQFEDYSKVVFEYCDPQERLDRRRTVFPQDLEKAFALGARMAEAAGGAGTGA